MSHSRLTSTRGGLRHQFFVLKTRVHTRVLTGNDGRPETMDELSAARQNRPHRAQCYDLADLPVEIARWKLIKGVRSDL